MDGREKENDGFVGEKICMIKAITDRVCNRCNSSDTIEYRGNNRYECRECGYTIFAGSPDDYEIVNHTHRAHDAKVDWKG